MSHDRPDARTRRRLLGVAAATGASALAGCTGGLSADFPGAGDTEATTATTTGPPLGDHPAAEGIADQARFGPPPADAEGVVVAFEDPSCPRCAAWETGTVPKLRERLGDRVAVVFRSYPVIYPWGRPATQAIEAAFARETGSKATQATTDERSTTTSGPTPYGTRQGSTATWALIRHYFENQDRFDADNVLDLTRAFLAEETDLDADAVVADAEAKAHDDAVQADLAGGDAAGVGRTTPTVFLFRDGEFRTSARGSISFRVVNAALGL
ncbi:MULTISPECIES: thioredoxin domain-containing protein [Halorussus]|uniref:DsbA family protein n=1 Tax=Halorussus TaxID=1070314 RepID=UPI000E2167D4|nr:MULTISPECIES: thioredoxin domain-containing protein [Halorussus]NHN58970.1 thioredoxin domain-containing protein [Halorussus sp. JP-T4]